MISGSQARIAVIGGLNMDIHLFGAGMDGRPGLLTAKDYLAEPGGKGANQARAVARLGASAVLVGRVGNDEFGRMCLDAVERDDVDTSFVIQTSDQRTGFVVIDLVEGHHITKVLVPGANDGLEWEHVEAALPTLARCDALVTQAEIPAAVLSAVLDWSAESGVPLFLDPSPPQAVTADMLAGAEAITPDVGEAGGLTGREVTTESVAYMAAADLVASGVRRVLVKMGAGGTLMAGVGGSQLIPTIGVERVDETGAGDVFMAGLVVARTGGAEWAEAVRFANVASALSVSRSGLSLPRFDEVQEALGSGAGES